MVLIFKRFLFLGVLISSMATFAQGDWFSSLYTGDGVELRADERVFTLYALLNAMGFDQAPVVRQAPLPKYQFHPVREQVRNNLLGLDVGLRKKIDAFFDAHPVSLERYLAFTLAGDAPPFSSAPKAREFADLKGFEALLSQVYSTAKLEDVLASVQSEQRKALKTYRTGLDEPLERARKLLKVPENGPRATLIVNLLDAQESARGVLSEKEAFLVVGPSETPNLEGAIREYARLFLEPKVSKKAQSGWGGGGTLLKEAQLLGAKEQTVGEYATAMLTRALALKALNAPDAAWEKASQAGYFGLKELSKGFEDAGSVETWMLDALAKAETRRPARK